MGSMWRSGRVLGTAVAGAVLAGLAVGGSWAVGGSAEPEPGTEVAQAVAKVDRNTKWQLTRRIELDFPTHHTQGFARVGDRLFLSTVEIHEMPVKYPEPVDGYDRTPGKGVGHVLVLDLQGKLLKDIVLGEGDSYHPGGIDADATSLWVPVAEYRPSSHSLVYRIDLRTLAVHKEFEVDDHIGGLVPEARTGRLAAVTWGSRGFYEFDRGGRVLSRTANPSHFLDYQDCAAGGRDTLVCTGITNYKTQNGTPFELGGLATVDRHTGAVRHEAPVQQYSRAGHVVTRNPVLLETEGQTLRMWAAPDDGEEGEGTEILVYEAPVG